MSSIELDLWYKQSPQVLLVCQNLVPEAMTKWKLYPFVNRDSFEHDCTIVAGAYAHTHKMQKNSM